MPVKKTVTANIILKGAIEVIRKYGVSELSVRAIAKELGTSTQPIYSEFEGIEDLRKALVAEASKREHDYVEKYYGKYATQYKAYGMGFVKFAQEEKELFRFLYFNKDIPRDKDVHYKEIINVMCSTYGITEESAIRYHDEMSIFSFGLAMLVNGGKNYSDEQLSALLDDEFLGLKSVHFKGDK